VELRALLETLMVGATREAALTMLELLLTDGLDVNERDSSGDTLLHWAARSGYPEAVALLLRHGADAGARNQTGQTPLEAAAASGQTDASRWFASLDGGMAP